MLSDKSSVLNATRPVSTDSERLDFRETSYKIRALYAARLLKPITQEGFNMAKEVDFAH